MVRSGCRDGVGRVWGSALTLLVVTALSPGVVSALTVSDRLVVPLEVLAPADRLEMTRVPVWLTVTGTSVGPTSLGQPTGEVVSFFEALLGPALSVTESRSPLLDGCFGGDTLTAYGWPGVTLSFAGDAGGLRNADPLVNYQFDEGVGSDLVLGVQTTRGATFADSLDAWLGLHPEASPVEGEPDLIGPTLQFPDGLIAEIGRGDNGLYVVQTLSALSPIFCE